MPLTVKGPYPLSLELTMPSTVPWDGGLSASLPRHFVLGYLFSVAVCGPKGLAPKKGL